MLYAVVVVGVVSVALDEAKKRDRNVTFYFNYTYREVLYVYVEPTQAVQ